MTSKYTPLEAFLSSQKHGSIPMTFSQIEEILGEKLPPSARKHRPWWSNNPSNSVITHAWLRAGYKTSNVDMDSEQLVFRRTRTSPGPSGATGSRTPSPPLRTRLHGALRGLVSFNDPDTLTKPTGEVWKAGQGQL